ncbi:CbiQ family ECF transporter T component, partial [Ornithinicoccus halotolerans]|uniref:CbiQ family ECF transporter T component n=1 Tax=Ornithinicoccus halotolerans TaxID=1748220 RepID=UPI001885F5EB
MPQPQPHPLTARPGAGGQPRAVPAAPAPVAAADAVRTPRLHPWAWWGWALGVAVAASTTTHPWLLLGLGVTVVAVVLGCRDDSPWARAIWAYVVLALVVVAIRLVFVVLMGGAGGATTVFRVPRVPLPEWAVGVNVGGPVTAERLLAGAQDALRLGLVLLAVGAANALANPKRALRSVPSALYDVSVAVVIAITVAPQLVQSTLRVRRARRLRGGRTRGLGAVRAIAVPVLEDAVDRSLALAAAMEVRGYGRTRLDGPPRRRLTGTLMSGSLVLLCLGVYLLLSAQAATPVAVALLLAGLVRALAVGPATGVAALPP